MTTDATLFQLLSTAPALTALVGQHIFPNFIPQGPRPPNFAAIVYQVVSDVPQNAFDGDATNRLVNARVQIDCYAKQHPDAQAVALAVDVLLTQLNPSTAGVAAWREVSRSFYDNEAQLHRVSMDMSLWL